MTLSQDQHRGPCRATKTLDPSREGPHRMHVWMRVCAGALTVQASPSGLFQQCKPHKRPVCGSNGKTYLNHCELHRDACLTGSKIQVDYDGHCKGKERCYYCLPAPAGGVRTEHCGLTAQSPFRLTTAPSDTETTQLLGETSSSHS